MRAFKLEFILFTAEKQNLHDRAMYCAKKYRRDQGELMAAIDDAEHAGVYKNFLLPSMFVYCVEILELSRANAYHFSARDPPA